MNRGIFTNLGGFPFTQGTLDFMQNAYSEALGAIAALAGNKVIITGAQVVGSNITAGWIAYNGELIRFEAGGVADDVVISEAITQATFEDATTHDAYVVRTAKPGTPGDFPFSDLVRLDTFKNDRWQSGDIKMITCDLDYIAANFVDGVGINERVGWLLCNGDNGTVNMNGRVPVGLQPGDDNFGMPGNTGGTVSETLTVNQIPAHGHSISTSNSADSSNSTGHPKRATDAGSVNTSGQAGSGKVIGLTGGGAAHNNLQPYLVTVFIQKA